MSKNEFWQDTQREQAIVELKIAQGNADFEVAHSRADEVLCRLLRSLGYDDVIDEYEKVERLCA